MKKLKLNLDEIKVESFEVNREQDQLGTILAAQTGDLCDTDLQCSNNCTITVGHYTCNPSDPGIYSCGPTDCPEGCTVGTCKIQC